MSAHDRRKDLGTVATSRRLRLFTEELLLQLRFELQWCILAANLETKLELAATIYRDASRVNAIRARLKEVDPTGGAPCWRSVASDARIRSCAEWLERREYLSEQIAGFLADIHPIVDGPSLQALAGVPGQMQVERAALDAMGDHLPERAAGFADFSGGSPGRDARFRFKVQGAPAAPRPIRTPEKLVLIYHGLLMSTEIPTIEACADLVLINPELPWEFTMDMARQIWDEARHAEIMMERIPALGGSLGQFPIDLSLWNLCQGQSLELRLAMHQRIGEWTGVDAAIYVSEQLRSVQYDLDAAIWEFIAADEITHVQIGNRWLEYLEPNQDLRDTIHRRAEGLRTQAGMLAHTFPFHEWACRASGFSESETEYLAKAASINAMESTNWVFTAE